MEGKPTAVSRVSTIRLRDLADIAASTSPTSDSKSSVTALVAAGSAVISQGQSIACGTHTSTQSRCQGVVFVAVSGLAKEHVHRLLTSAGGQVLECQDEDEEGFESDLDDFDDN